MEDFGSIVWFLVVAGLGIYSMVARKKKAADQKQEHGEVWPSWTQEAEEAEEEVVSQREYTSMQPEFEEGTDAEPAFTDESQYSSTGYEALSSNVHNEGVHAPEASRVTEKATRDLLTTPDKPNLQPETDENASEQLEFDLRKAVIYSEILKPKFEE